MSQINKTGIRDKHISIISHGQWHLVKQVLHDLNNLDSRKIFQVTLTLNIAEDIDDCSNFSFPVVIIRNKFPKGFGANHNQAFETPFDLLSRRYFFVLNPDLRFDQDVFSKLALQLGSNPDIGVVAPLVVNSNGELEDSIRDLPTPWIILKKIFHQQKVKFNIDSDNCFNPDWVAGVFMGFRSKVFNEIHGFDEHFFLYYEDVHLCSRLWLQGLQVEVDPGNKIIHHARRSSHRDLKYLKWHLNSMLKFFTSSVFRQVYRFHKTRR